ncbi:MAG: type III-B CRISPR module-associated Cmr3 family protein [Thermoguttaceae bacterium]|nr:type III-B CRISPR module-associated Cmr3 family protein [Thermoguttaceae bacterium]
MPRWLIEAVVESPIVIRRQRQSQRSEGAEYVPGTQVRGAFARAYLWQKGRADATFYKVFSEESGCRFGPLDPGQYCFPKTAYSCKRYPGFPSQNGHGVVDLLPEFIRWSLTGQPPTPQRCAQCGHDLKAMGGFYGRDSFGNLMEMRGRWRRTMKAHVGIERLTRTAAEAVFFHLPALEPEPEPSVDGSATAAIPKLYGWIEADQAQLSILQEVLQKEEGILRIGHARTRGYGRVRIQILDQAPDCAQELEAWSQKLVAKLDCGLDPNRHLLFSLSLPTGAILVDEVLRYTLDPSMMVPWLPRLPAGPPGRRETFGNEKQFADGYLRTLAAITQHERVRGWNFAQGLPRADEWMISRGSVYVYLYKGGSQGRRELLKQLKELEAAGVGARLAEGFGKVVVGDSFHVDL